MSDTPPRERPLDAPARAPDAKDLVRQHRDELRKELSVGPLTDGGAGVTRLDYERHEIRLISTSTMEQEWRAHSCAKEPWTVAWLEGSFKKGQVLFDVGANVGAFSLIAATLCGKSGRVVAFEPGYATFAHLCDNIVLNQQQGVVMPVPLALGQATGISTFTYRTLHPGQSRHSFREGIWKARAATGADRYSQPVLTMPLDEMVKSFGFRQPTHIKLDVDGAELNVLKGASATLDSPALESILVEIDDNLTEPVTELLVSKGFVLGERHHRDHEEMTQVWYGVFNRAS